MSDERMEFKVVWNSDPILLTELQFKPPHLVPRGLADWQAKVAEELREMLADTHAEGGWLPCCSVGAFIVFTRPVDSERKEDG